MPTIEELRHSIETLQAERDRVQFSANVDWMWKDRDLRFQIEALREKLLIAQEAQRHAY